MASVQRVADGSFTLHDYPSRRAALYAIDLQRVYAALDLTRSRPTLYMLAVGRALVLTLVVGPILHRLTVPVLETYGLLALQSSPPQLSLGHASGPSDAGRWSPPGFCSSRSDDSSSGGAVSPPLLPRQAHDCDERQVAGGATARRHEQGDFGSVVEAEPEQATQGYCATAS